MKRKNEEERMLGLAVGDAVSEVLRAGSLGFGPPRSAHEGFAIIQEEFDELKAHVWTNQKRRDVEKTRAEAIQVAAMALRFAAQCRNGNWLRK